MPVAKLSKPSIPSATVPSIKVPESKPVKQEKKAPRIHKYWKPVYAFETPQQTKKIDDMVMK